jgi:transcriptional regulator with XRE-family HTH domain
MREWTVAGSLVWQARTERRMSQRELAEASGVPQSTIAAIERGRREPSIPVLLRVLRGAGKEVRFVLGDLEEDALTQRGERVGDVAAVFRAARVPG